MFKVNHVKMLEQPPTFFHLTIDDASDDYCVYEIWDGAELLYIGLCRYAQLMQFPDAQGNSKFRERISRSKPFNMRVIARGDRFSCNKYRYSMARSLNPIPPCNLAGITSYFQQIECVEDGKIYRTQKEAAEAYGISQGNLSSHLRGRAGFKQVRGHTFRYVTG